MCVCVVIPLIGRHSAPFGAQPPGDHKTCEGRGWDREGERSHPPTRATPRAGRLTRLAGKRAFAMTYSSQSPPRRNYGSLEHDRDDGVAESPPVPEASNRDSFDHLRERRAGGEQSGGKPWGKRAVVGTLILGVMLILAHGGYGLPASTSNDVASSLNGKSNIIMRASELPVLPVNAQSGSRSSSSRGAGKDSSVPDAAKFPPGPAVTVDLLGPLSFTALNFYHERDGKPALDYPWLKDVKLIEPHRETALAVSTPREGYEYRWEIRGADPEQADLRATASGPEAVILLTILDDNIITLEEADPQTQIVTRRLVEKAIVKYVRREIRTLTEEEREELLEAMYTLWSVRADGGNGKELYGEDYADIYAINRLHFKAASPLDCDFFHDGLGFLTNHAVISNTFEYSLQKVNPKLTLPYWDFTIDESSAGGGSGESVSSAQGFSPIFTPAWFGTMDPTDNMVKDGRWAYTPIPQMEFNNPGGVLPDVYGKLRAPWNVNNRPYLTRGMGNTCGYNSTDAYPWPTCKTHYELVTAFSDFYSFVWESLYDPHGPVHVWIGGELDCEETFSEIGDLVGEDAAESLAILSFCHRKRLYRGGIFKCEGSAEVSEKPDELFASGRCGCLDYDLTQGDDYEAIYTALYIDYYMGDASSDIKRQVVALICGSIVNNGDHLQASSSLDPSFWPMHPTIERLWMYSILTGHVTDFTWPDEDTTYTNTDDTTVSEFISFYGDTCSGHRGSDVFPFGLLDTDIDGFTVKTGVRGNLDTGNTFTNRQLLQAFDARSNSLSYVYDNFKWTHCEA
ncbi:unnamed protein product, partial [Pylaiella littoralis]